MYKYLSISACAVIINISSIQANTKLTTNTTRDSIGVENSNGKKVIIHQIVAKDTYYSVARRYGVNPKDLMSFNDSKFLQIGVIIKVPTSIPFTGPSATSSNAKTPIGNSNTVPLEEASAGNLIEHAVAKKENLNMLAEKYGTTVNEIKRINNLRSINLQIGQILKIPSQNPPEEVSDVIASQPEKPSVPIVTSIPKPIEEKKPVVIMNTPATINEDFIEHTVAGNETMYSIATRYKITMDQLKAKNNLTNNSLSVGQKLLIKGQYPVKPTPLDPTSAQAIDTTNSLKDPSLRYPASRYGLNQVDEKGTATWIVDPDLDPTKMLVLHRSAPIGTVMKITNPMSNRTTFAKVVGKFTENESTKDIIIVMTKAVADALGALDKRFYCNLTYGGQENEQK
ncbi:MAG: LysM peptidoglycan-binding domain-containing protein [Pedobacter sp.]|nr:MAG: LysM peptidoglycan-binding domain-containing protein [Pedobacter sp.]